MEKILLSSILLFSAEGFWSVVLLCIGIPLFILFIASLQLIFSFLFSDFYYPKDFKIKEEFLKNLFNHFVIGEKLSNTDLKEINFKSGRYFRYHYKLLDDIQNKEIGELIIDIPVLKFWARWILRRLNNLGDPANSSDGDTIDEKNNIWVVKIIVFNKIINQTKDNISSDSNQETLTLLEISDEELTKEIGLDAYESKVNQKEPSSSEPELVITNNNNINTKISQKSSLYVNFSQKQAIDELKKQQELFKLDVINEKEFERIKSELKLIILNNNNVKANLFFSTIDYFRNNYLVIIIIILLIVFFLSLLDISIIDFFENEKKMKVKSRGAI
jgi:hypothetical protein